MSEARSYAPATSHTLIERFLGGDRSAGDRFYNLYGPIVMRFARHARLQDSDAEDVVANVMRNFLRWRENGGAIDWKKGRFRYFLRSVVNHEILHVRERAARRPESLQTATEEGAHFREPAGNELPPDAACEEIEMQELFRASVEELFESPALRPRDLLAFQRYALNHEDSRTVARELDVSVGRLFVIKHEMIRVLRAIVQRRLAELEATPEDV